MPIYEFECLNCSERFDRLQKLSDPDPDSCPNCGATGVRRRLTAPSFRLSGSGWYETDFKKDGDKKRNLVDKGEPAKGDAAPAKCRWRAAEVERAQNHGQARFDDKSRARACGDACLSNEVGR